MNIKKIREAVTNYNDDDARHLIIGILAEDENVIPTIMQILDYERERKKKLLTEINFQLSRAHLTIERPDINKNNFVFNEIVKFYKKNSDQVGHCLANMDKYKDPIPKEDEDKLSWS